MDRPPPHPLKRPPPSRHGHRRRSNLRHAKELQQQHRHHGDNEQHINRDVRRYAVESVGASSISSQMESINNMPGDGRDRDEIFVPVPSQCEYRYDEDGTTETPPPRRRDPRSVHRAPRYDDDAGGNASGDRDGGHYGYFPAPGAGIPEKSAIPANGNRHPNEQQRRRRQKQQQPQQYDQRQRKRKQDEDCTNNLLQGIREQQSMQAPRVKQRHRVAVGGNDEKKNKYDDDDDDRVRINTRVSLLSDLLDQNKNIMPGKQGIMVEQHQQRQQEQKMESLEAEIPRKKKRRHTDNSEISSPSAQQQQSTDRKSFSSRKVQRYPKEEVVDDDDDEDKLLESNPFPKYQRGKKGTTPPNDDCVQIADSTSEEQSPQKISNGQATREYVELLETDPAPPKLKSPPQTTTKSKGMLSQSMGKMGSIVQNAARSVKNVAHDFMTGGAMKTRSAINSNENKRKKKGNPIKPGCTLGQGQRQIYDSWSSIDILDRRKSTRSVKKVKKDPDHIVIDSSDDDDIDHANDGSVVQYQVANFPGVLDPMILNRIAIGDRVFDEGCNVEVTKGGKLVMHFCTPHRRKTRNNSSNTTEQLQLNIKKDIQNLFYYRAQSDVDFETSHGSFLAITTKVPCAQAIRSISPNYDPDSNDQIHRFIVIECTDIHHFKMLIEAMKSQPSLDELFHEKTGVDCLEAKGYCHALLEDNLKENKKANQFAPDFLAGRADEDVVLVYPFSGDKITMEKAADGLIVLSRFGLSDSAISASSKDSDKEDESNGTRTHCLTISVNDCNRLAPEVYLNDTLIDFFMKWMTRNDEPETSPCHYFSTHFYSKLCKEGPEGVQKWTERKGIDIFQKRLIFVPVNKTLHWSLAVIVNPGAIDDHCDLMDKYGFSLNENVLATVGDHPCPVILFFDSLKCHPRSSVAKNLRNWLNAEWRRKMGGRIDRREDPFKPNTMKVITPGAPPQENAYDCGVFTCRNAFAITMLKDRKFSYADLESESNIFENVFVYDHGDIDRIRKEMLTLIERLSKMYEACNAEQKRLKQAAKMARQRTGPDGDKSDTDGNAEDAEWAPKTPSKSTQDSGSMFSSQSPGFIEVWDATYENQPKPRSTTFSANGTPLKDASSYSDKVLIEQSVAGDQDQPRPSGEELSYDGITKALEKKHGKANGLVHGEAQVLNLTRVRRPKLKAGQSRATLKDRPLDSLQRLEWQESPKENATALTAAEDNMEQKDAISDNDKVEAIDIDNSATRSQDSDPSKRILHLPQPRMDEIQPNPTNSTGENNASFLRTIVCRSPMYTTPGQDEFKGLRSRTGTPDMSDAKGSSAENAVEIQEDEDVTDRKASSELLQVEKNPSPSTPSSRSSSKVLEVEIPERTTNRNGKVTVDSVDRKAPKDLYDTEAEKQHHKQFKSSSRCKATFDVTKSDATSNVSPSKDATTDQDDDDDYIEIVGTSGNARSINRLNSTEVENEQTNNEPIHDVSYSKEVAYC